MGLLRRRWPWFALGALVLLVVAVMLAVLPEIVRRVAVDQIIHKTGRAAQIEDVDVNVFTGRLALKGFRLAQKGSNDPALEFQQVVVRMSHLSLLRKHARIVDLTVTAPRVYVARTGPETFDFSDLLALIPPADPNQKPSGFVTTIEHLGVSDGLVVARDLVTSPPSEWRLESLAIEAGGLTTRPNAPPGRLTVKARVNDADIEVSADALALAPMATDTRFTLTGFRLAPVNPYVPIEIRTLPREGVVRTTLTLKASRGADGTLGAVVSGDIAIEGLALLPRGGTVPFATVKRLALNIKEANLATRKVTIGALEVDTFAVDARRAPDGTIDLLGLIAARVAREEAAGRAGTLPAAPAPAPAAPETPPPPPVSLTFERLALVNGSIEFNDAAVSPVTTLAATDVTLTVRDLTYPSAKPSSLELALNLPERGRLTVTGTATTFPIAADIKASLRGAAIAPYAPYFPVRARFTGVLNADTHSQLRLVDDVMAITSRSQSSIENLQVVDPSRPAGSPPVVRVSRVAISGLQLEWPKSLKVARVAVTKPDLRLERAADGSIPMRTLFTPPSAAASTPVIQKVATKAPAERPAAKPGPGAAARSTALPLAIDVGSIVIDDGLVRFQDDTTTPPFVESISRLAVKVDNVSTTPGKYAKVQVQAVVGGNAALELKGELAPLGQLHADLVGELRDFTLPSVNPYADNAIAWIMKRGKLAARVHVRVHEDELTVTDDIVVADLDVAPSQGSDEVKKRLGLPLSLIVSLIKDSQGQIKINVPVSGKLSDPQFDFGETVWRTIKNVIVNVLAAPFRAIGRLFTGSDNTIEKLAVEPVVFPPGSADVPPDMDAHLVRVAGFLRGAPGITLAVTSVVDDKDLEALRGQELTARVQKLQREKRLASYPAAVTAEFRVRWPNVKPPTKPEDQLARLLDAEPPAPQARVKELQDRRLQVVRETLSKREGIAETRLRSGEPDAGGAADASRGGRVELTIAE